MSVKEYYYEHFAELSPAKQFHFATRMNNFFKTRDFDNYLEHNKPNKNLTEILSNNNYSKLVGIEQRKPFFEKYPKTYGLEAALFRVHHLLKEYNLDIRDDLTKQFPLEKLYRTTDDLLNDDGALENLSSLAINTICLVEELFPRDKNVTRALAEWAWQRDFSAMNPSLILYLCTHIVICESEFYTKDIIKTPNRALLAELLKKCSDLIMANIDTISLDPCIEYLVCCKLMSAPDKETEERVNSVCKSYIQSLPYLVNYRRGSTHGDYFHSLDGAEHINTLYIMSGLDEINSRPKKQF